MNKDLIAIFEYLEKEKGIPRERIATTIEQSLIAAARKSIKRVADITAHIDPKSGDIRVFEKKEVVASVTSPEEEISLEESREIEPHCEIGDCLEIPIDPTIFGRIAAQTARQVIAQHLRAFEKETIYQEYRHRKHEIISGTVTRVLKKSTLVVELDKVEAILPGAFYPKSESYQPGDRVQAIIWEVRDTENERAEIILSRRHAEMVKKLFEQEVPELREKIVTIKMIAREAGYRTKIAVQSNDPKVDPVGALVGMRGTRVKNVIRALNNEKIDIVNYSEDATQLLNNLFDPIEIQHLHYDKEENTLSLVVEDEDYPTVIGKRGVNARLNEEIIGSHLEIKKISQYRREIAFEQSQMQDDPALDVQLTEVEGLNAFVMDSLMDGGLDTPRKILNTPIEEIGKKTGMSKEMVSDLIEKMHQIRT